jgi:hypothetical protein
MERAMRTYRAKTGVTFEAVQWDGSRESAEAIVTAHGYVRDIVYRAGGIGIEVQAYGGTLVAKPGDWIVRVKDKIFDAVVSSDAFAATYEPAD